MKILEPLYVSVIEKLIDGKVDFLLIGGYAVNYYGYGRFTGDMDFWLRPDNENRKRFINALHALKRNQQDIEEINKLDFRKAQVISIGEPPLRVDFLTRVNLVNFEEAWEATNFFQLNSMKVPVVNYHHLVLTKLNTGRPQDKLDLEQLQRINNYKEKKSLTFHSSFEEMNKFDFEIMANSKPKERFQNITQTILRIYNNVHEKSKENLILKFDS